MKKLKLFFVFLSVTYAGFIVAQPVIGTTLFTTSSNVALAANGLCTAPKTATLQGWAFTVSTTNTCGIQWNGNGTTFEGSIIFSIVSGNWSYGIIQSNDGSEFSLTNLSCASQSTSWTGVSAVFVGYRNGSPVSGATLTSTPLVGGSLNTNTTSVSFTGNPAFNNIDEVRLTPSSPVIGNWVLLDITIAAPVQVLTATQSQVNLTCNGVCTGQASVVASGGTGPYTYAWSPAGGSGATASSLCATNYTCTITDAASNSITKTFNITQPPAIVVTPISQTNITCNGGATGAAQATASGGTGTLSYNWTPGYPTGDGTGSVSGLSANVWTVTVTDGNSCTANRTFNVTQPSALVVVPVSQTNVFCNGGSNGAASVSVSGGQPTYSYNWTPGNPTGDGTASVSGLSANVWTCTVTDANSCVKTATFNVIAPTAIVTSTAVTNVACNGGSNGVAAITASGGAGSYTYLWSNGGTTSAITGLMAGVYTATVTDANSCTSIKSAQVTQPTAIVTTTAVTNVSCNGGSNGVASVSASGGAGSYTYSWTPSGGAAATASGLAQGNYTVTITDANSCIQTAFANVTQPTVLTANANASAILCNGGMTTVTVTANDGTPAYSGVGTFTAMAGTHTYTVTDVNGCMTTTSVSISEPAAIVNSQTVTLCEGQSVVVGANTYTAVGTYTDVIAAQNTCDSTVTTMVIINNLPNITVNSGAICTGQSFTIVPGGADTYTISGGTDVVTPTSDATYTVSGTDVNGCVSADAISSVTVNALPTIMAMTNNTLLCTGETATLSVTGSATSYTWNTTETTTDIAVSPTTTTTYTVEGTAANGCANTTTITQDVSLCTGIAMLNATEGIINVYPNPNNGIFYIELTTDSKVSIMNALGQTIVNEAMSTGKHELDLHNQADGIYFVKVIQNNKQQTIKIIKK